MQVRVGCCGFPVGHRKYFRAFRVVELQSTFYQLPKEETAIRWRQEAPPEFEFVVKAWQAITHPLSSPTWRRAKHPRGQRSKYGLLRPTKENFAAWNDTLVICRMLGATLCLIQCPPQLGYTSRNVRNLERFFSEIERAGMVLLWEPRGNWASKRVQLKRLCERLELVHVVDPLRNEPAHLGDTAYFRLHGLGSKQFNYSYEYSADDLSRLSEKMSELPSQGVKLAYVMFNTVSMFRDARRFQGRSRLLAE